ncbi:MAG: metallophosphoesterase [Phycisphaerae bacterium]
MTIAPQEAPAAKSPPAERPRLTRRRFLQTLVGIGVLGAGTWGYARHIEVYRLVIEQITVPISGLAARRHNCRIVQLSDLHAGNTKLAHIERALRLAAELRPDFLVLTGDNVDSEGADLAALCRVLKPVTAQIETLGITGNHDFGDNFHHLAYADRLCAALTAAGVRMLRNEVYQPRPGGGPGELAFVGVEDLWAGQMQPATLDQAPADSSVILLSHNPDSYEALDPHRFHLMLSGHTHGGQVCLPFYGPPILPVEHKERAAGLFHLTPRHPERALYVNRGVGYLRRIRLFCPPEITCITLQNPTLA